MTRDELRRGTVRGLYNDTVSTVVVIQCRTVQFQIAKE
jgi:hypothetical protein